MKVYEQAGYTKEEFDLRVQISPQLYKQLKDKVYVLERQNFTLAQDNRVLETKIALLESQLSRANEIIDALL